MHRRGGDNRSGSQPGGVLLQLQSLVRVLHQLHLLGVRGLLLRHQALYILEREEEVGGGRHGGDGDEDRVIING